MSLREVFFFVGPGGDRDGMIFHVGPLLRSCTAAEMVNWIDNGVEPDLSALDDKGRAFMREHVNVVRTRIQNGDQRGVTSRTGYALRGWNTGLGQEDALNCGVVIMDLTDAEVEELIPELIDDDGEKAPARPHERARFNYPAALTGPEVADLRNKGRKVTPSREHKPQHKSKVVIPAGRRPKSGRVR